MLSGLRIWRCHELWCRSQTQLTSGVAVAVVADFLIGPLAWEPPYASDVGLKTKEKKKIQKTKTKNKLALKGNINLGKVVAEVAKLKILPTKHFD